MTNTIHKTVMRRVYVIHAINRFANSFVLAGAFLMLALWGIGREVWVARVLENMPSLTDVGAAAQFMVAAFANTDIVVQALSLVVLLSVVWLGRETARTISAFRFA